MGRNPAWALGNTKVLFPLDQRWEALSPNQARWVGTAATQPSLSSASTLLGGSYLHSPEPTSL
jgi:hypothetical protein